MDFTIFFHVIVSDLSKRSHIFKTKHNCEVEKYSHVDIDAYTALSAHYNNKHLS